MLSCIAIVCDEMQFITFHQIINILPAASMDLSS